MWHSREMRFAVFHPGFLSRIWTDTYSKNTRLAYLDTIGGNYSFNTVFQRSFVHFFVLIKVSWCEIEPEEIVINYALFLHFDVTKNISILRIIAIYPIYII